MEKRSKVLWGVLTVLAVAAFFTIGLEKLRERPRRSSLGDIYSRVASDAADKYEIAKRQGDPIQICVQAGLVSAAYLEAKDETSYARWKAVQKADCARAGMP